MDDLLQEFIAETRETLDALAGEIVAWEADPADRARLDSIFRFVHTVKGSCGFLDLPRLARLSHAAEDVLQSVRSGERAADPALVNAVLAIVDRIGEIVEAIDAGAALDDSAEDLLLAALEGKAQTGPASELAPVVVPITSAPRAPARSIRLSVDLLDRMMNGVSEMVLARNELARRLRDSGDTTLETAVDRLSMTVAELRDTVTRTRMQTIDSLFSALPRLVRDTAAALGKKVSLSIDGADVELDREMIELLRDPLVHIVRNAIDHGIEAPEARRGAGKPEAGRLAIVARQSGNRIIVEVADDGQGIDTAKLLAKRIAQEPARAAELGALDQRARLNLIFEPGLSTRDEATTTSGRGVGMDVVRTNVEQIGGSIRLDNVAGRGLTTTIEVPLTLAILSAIIIEAGDQHYAVPRQAIEEIVAVGSDAVRCGWRHAAGERARAAVAGDQAERGAWGRAAGGGGWRRHDADDRQPGAWQLRAGGRWRRRYAGIGGEAGRAGRDDGGHLCRADAARYRAAAAAARLRRDCRAGGAAVRAGDCGRGAGRGGRAARHRRADDRGARRAAARGGARCGRADRGGRAGILVPGRRPLVGARAAGDGRGACRSGDR
jgi:two-component system chemotaxis sensor kinase CheA